MIKDESAVSMRPAKLFVTGAFVGFATFVMSVSLITVYVTGSSLFGDAGGLRIYAFCILAWTIGFFAYAAIDKLIKMKTARQILFVAVSVICAFTFSNVAFAFSKSAYASLSLLCLFLFGTLYAAVYHKTALRLNGSPYTGRVIGCAIAGIELAD